MVRHVSDARLVERCALLGLQVVGEVVHQHITDVAEQCAACETACSYQADREKRSEEYAEDHAEAKERGGANQCTRVRVMGIVELLEEWDAMIDPSVYDILDEKSRRQGPRTK